MLPSPLGFFAVIVAASAAFRLIDMVATFVLQTMRREMVYRVVPKLPFARGRSIRQTGGLDAPGKTRRIDVTTRSRDKLPAGALIEADPSR